MCCRADLNGKLLGAPELQGIECFSGAENGLKPVAVDAWGPLVFVNMTAAMTDDGALPLAMCCAAVMLANGEDTAVALHEGHMSPDHWKPRWDGCCCGNYQHLGAVLTGGRQQCAPARTAKLKFVG